VNILSLRGTLAAIIDTVNASRALDPNLMLKFCNFYFGMNKPIRSLQQIDMKANCLSLVSRKENSNNPDT
jgi:hypothetical protein